MEEAVGILFFGIFALIWLLAFGIGIAGFVLWLLMIIDVAKRNFKNPDDKTTWILVVVLANWIGALVYYFVVRRNPEKFTKH